MEYKIVNKIKGEGMDSVCKYYMMKSVKKNEQRG